MKECHVEREIGGRMMRMETGVVAKLANACVMITHGDSTVMCSAVRANPRPGLDFFPLQCDYRERTSAAGKFPGGFRKRGCSERERSPHHEDDRSSDSPSLPRWLHRRSQLQCWVMSHDGQNDTDVLACTGASASLNLTDAPFEGPVATVRVGRITTEQGEQFVLNPTQAQMEYSDLDLVLSGHVDGVNMIEVGAAEVPDEDVLKAIEFGYEEGIKPLLEMMNELREKAGGSREACGRSLAATSRHHREGEGSR